ncbi:MAG: hypothetical protein LBU39_07890 [Desulfobulbaceae bacterium]|jgi:hypothetical protein|nr:hypothetical protein [Desulfobulbaceae bacterium]
MGKENRASEARSFQAPGSVSPQSGRYMTSEDVDKRRQDVLADDFLADGRYGIVNVSSGSTARQSYQTISLAF